MMKVKYNLVWNANNANDDNDDDNEGLRAQRAAPTENRRAHRPTALQRIEYLPLRALFPLK